MFPENEVLNLVNYMTSSWNRPTFNDSRFLGFIPIEDGSWGVDLGGQICAACHLFRTGQNLSDDETFHWGDDPRDTAELAEEKPWVLMFKGNDNTSCFSRFSTEQKALDFFSRMKNVTLSDHLFYNS
jgi:hypothetical protein